MSIVLNGSTGVVFPAGGTGNTAGAAVGTTDTQTLSNKTLTSPTITGATINSSTLNGGSITLGTAQDSTSGTNIDFTGIPSWVKRITVMFSGVSLSGTSSFLIQIGDSGGIETTGYSSSSTSTTSSTGATLNSTSGFIWRLATAAHLCSGHMVITNVTSNTWVSSHCSTLDASTAGTFGGGTKALSDTLTQVRITTVNGTNTFDDGTINIMYEG